MTMQNGTEGFGALSPDARRVVYEFVPNGGPIQTQLWVKDLSTGQELQLTTQTQPRTDDVFPIWRPNGQEIWFMREVYPPDFSTFAITLMRQNASGGVPSVVFGSDQQVGGVAFSAAGDRLAMFSLQGIEIVDAATLQRSVVLPHAAFAGKSFWLGSLFWSADRDLLAFVVSVGQTNQWEIWTVKPDGTDQKMIHTEMTSVMYLGGFVKP
jgi:Tol biopolymer transport system component